MISLPSGRACVHRHQASWPLLQRYPLTPAVYLCTHLPPPSQKLEMAKISSVHNLKPSSSGKLRNWQTEARVKVGGEENEKKGRAATKKWIFRLL